MTFFFPSFNTKGPHTWGADIFNFWGDVGGIARYILRWIRPKAI